MTETNDAEWLSDEQLQRQIYAVPADWHMSKMAREIVELRARVAKLEAALSTVRAEATLAERERLTGFKDDKLKELQDLRLECENLQKRLGMYEHARTSTQAEAKPMDSCGDFNLLCDALAWFDSHEVEKKLGHMPWWVLTARERVSAIFPTTPQ